MGRHQQAVKRTIDRWLPQGPKMGAEIGVWEGNTSAALLNAFPQLTLLMVDPYDLDLIPSEGVKKYISASYPLSGVSGVSDRAADVTRFAADRRIILRGTSATAGSIVKEGCLDFAFIDGDHTLPAVREDLITWSTKIRVGGLLMGHDYNGRGDKSGDYGVKRAVDEFASRTGRSVHVSAGLLWAILLS